MESIRRNGKDEPPKDGELEREGQKDEVVECPKVRHAYLIIRSGHEYDMDELQRPAIGCQNQ